MHTTPSHWRLEHQPKCSASIRDVQFSWVLSQEQEKILPYLEFTIIYLGISTTPSLPNPDSPPGGWERGTGTLPDLSPSTLPLQHIGPAEKGFLCSFLSGRNHPAVELSLSRECFAFSPRSRTSQPPGLMFAGKGSLGE